MTRPLRLTRTNGPAPIVHNGPLSVGEIATRTKRPVQTKELNNICSSHCLTKTWPSSASMNLNSASTRPTITPKFKIGKFCKKEHAGRKMVPLSAQALQRSLCHLQSPKRMSVGSEDTMTESC